MNRKRRGRKSEWNVEGMRGDGAGNGEGLVVRRRKVRKMIGRGENLEVRGGAVRQGRKMTGGDNGGAAVRRWRPVAEAAAAAAA